MAQSNQVFSRARELFRLFVMALSILGLIPEAQGQSNEDCLECHGDPELEALDGRIVFVNHEIHSASIHEELDCIDCHDQPGDYEDFPHYDIYRKVDCAECHDEATENFVVSFHGRALARGTPGSPDCIKCHSKKSDPHAIQALDFRSAENSCRLCHTTETGRYDSSVHFAAAQEGKESPGCVSCHPTHAKSLPPSAGAIDQLCKKCHVDAMEELKQGAHKLGEDFLQGPMSCASCHDVHATHKPKLDKGIIESCNNCHPGYDEQFSGSVHELLLRDDKMSCLSCHKTHQATDTPKDKDFGCGACHEDVEKEYRGSAHRLARLHKDKVAATCADCHGGHHILGATNRDSPVHRTRIPDTCGECHTDEEVITSDYVRLPISLPNYAASVHGKGLKKGKKTAICTDCHGVHDLRNGSDPESSINKMNLSRTCGKCHEKAAQEYGGSVHGRALAHGITDSPSCTDCHEEHLIRDTKDPESAVFKGHQGDEVCASCHEDPEMAARYGLPADAIQTFRDSYHGWAIGRGGKRVASCEDCHNIHDIRSRLDPSSSIHPDNVVATCGRCHPKSNETFAASYTHVLARDRMLIHDWVRVIYIVLIVVVLAGMAVHNLVIFIHAMRKSYRNHRKEESAMRMGRSEIWQHVFLAVSFTGLAVTGFTLRFSDSWWAELLIRWGLTEEIRRVLHRAFAVIMVVVSLYHVLFIFGSRRGRTLITAMLPRPKDLFDALGNMAYHLGWKKKRPSFAMYDYTQKAEYWALIWGTILMVLTGIVLMYPDTVTHVAPAWVVRVAETIHFYEAILAVSAIVIWHFFFVILLPEEYPMSWTWITGRMSVEHWRKHHPAAMEQAGILPEEISDHGSPSSKGKEGTGSGEGKD